MLWFDTQDANAAVLSERRHGYMLASLLPHHTSVPLI